MVVICDPKRYQLDHGEAQVYAIIIFPHTPLTIRIKTISLLKTRSRRSFVIQYHTFQEAIGILRRHWHRVPNDACTLLHTPRHVRDKCGN